MNDVLNRAAGIRLVLTDCDGVLTDGGVYYSARGEEMKRFNIHDGMGVKRLQKAGIETGVVTGEMSPSVVRRCEKLGIQELHLGASEKLTVVEKILATRDLSWSEIAYVGDDVNDVEVLQRAGLSACPANALEEVKGVVHLVLEKSGGQGAFRELAEKILKAKLL